MALSPKNEKFVLTEFELPGSDCISISQWSLWKWWRRTLLRVYKLSQTVKFLNNLRIFKLLNTSMFVIKRLKSSHDNIILCITLRNVTFFNSSSHSDPVTAWEVEVTTVRSGDKWTCTIIHFYEGLIGVNRQPSNGQKSNRQPLKTDYFYRQPSNERARISRQISQISLNDRDRLT